MKSKEEIIEKAKKKIFKVTNYDESNRTYVKDSFKISGTEIELLSMPGSPAKGSIIINNRTKFVIGFCFDQKIIYKKYFDDRVSLHIYKPELISDIESDIERNFSF
jgi:hypothetical protein